MFIYARLSSINGFSSVLYLLLSLPLVVQLMHMVGKMALRIGACENVTNHGGGYTSHSKAFACSTRFMRSRLWWTSTLRTWSGAGGCQAINEDPFGRATAEER